MPVAQRIEQMPAYVFAELADAKARIEATGHRVIDLGASDPDWPPHPSVVAALAFAQEAHAHRYPPYRGWRPLREAVAKWYQRRFGVQLDPDREVLITNGSKVALVHLALAVVDPGGLVIVPDPGYPAYRMPGYLFGCSLRTLELDPRRGFLPDFHQVKANDWERAQLIYLNYPNNPTGAIAPLQFWEQAVEWARRWDVVICSDLAYVDMVWDGRATSVLEVPAAKECAVESLTFSKSYSMQGWRLGAVVGNAEVIEALYKVESQVNAGVFLPIQRAGVVALELGPQEEALAAYRARRQWMAEALEALGFAFTPPPATLYFWLPLPGGLDGKEYAQQLLRRAHLLVTPGEAFGEAGRHFVRVSLTRPQSELERAVAAWKEALPLLVAP